MTQQAEQFLKTVGATCKIEFVGYGKHFEDDKVCRNIYNVTLTRIKEGINTGIKTKRSYSFKFGDSYQNTNGGKEPTAYDVLTCLTKQDFADFTDFCEAFGYDQDSIKAKRIFKAVQRQYKGVERVFGDVMEQLNEIN